MYILEMVSQNTNNHHKYLAGIFSTKKLANLAADTELSGWEGIYKPCIHEFIVDSAATMKQSDAKLRKEDGIGENPLYSTHHHKF
jgi:hypothetical protein